MYISVVYACVMCANMCGSISVCMHMCTWTWRQEAVVWVSFLITRYLVYWGLVSHSDLEFFSLTCQLSQLASVVPSRPDNTGVTSWILGVWILLVTLVRWTLCSLSHPPSPTVDIFARLFCSNVIRIFVLFLFCLFVCFVKLTQTRGI